MRTAYHGGSVQNEAAGYMAEFIARRRLAKLGFHTELKHLDSIKAEVFCVMDTELQEMENQELRKARNHGKR